MNNSPTNAMNSPTTYQLWGCSYIDRKLNRQSNRAKLQGCNFALLKGD